MRLDWQQLTPRERDTALKHYILHGKLDSPVTAQKVCEEMSHTHFLFCNTSPSGPSVYKFMPAQGKKTGMAVSDDLNEGIYKAALRALGVDVTDRKETPFSPPPKTPARTRAR
jgi:hypothetical protein